MATEDTSAVRRQETETSALNREAVIQAALEMLDTVGIDGLSMRALADHLEVAVHGAPPVNVTLEEVGLGVSQNSGVGGGT